jgi:hypothetical protein
MPKEIDVEPHSKTVVRNQINAGLSAKKPFVDLSWATELFFLS